MMQRRKRTGVSPARAARVRVSTSVRAATTPSRTVPPRPGRARTSRPPAVASEIADKLGRNDFSALARASGPTPRRPHGARRRRGGRLRHLPPRAVVGAAGIVEMIRRPSVHPTIPSQRGRVGAGARASRPSAPVVLLCAQQPGGFSLARTDSSAAPTPTSAQPSHGHSPPPTSRSTACGPDGPCRELPAHTRPTAHKRRAHLGRIAAASQTHLGHISAGCAQAAALDAASLPREYIDLAPAFTKWDPQANLRQPPSPPPATSATSVWYRPARTSRVIARWLATLRSTSGASTVRGM